MLHRDEALRAGVRNLPRTVRVRWVDDWDELLREVPLGPEGTVLIVDPFDRAGRLAAELLTLQRQYPSAVVLAAMRLERLSPPDIRRLGELGVADVVRVGIDTAPYRLERVITQARERAALRAVLATVPRSLAPRAQVLLEAALSTVLADGGPAELARTLFVSPRTLQRRCARSGLPPPRTLLALLRVVLAARFLADPGRTVLSAALAAGYATDTSLHRAFRRVGLPSPARLRGPQALERAVEAFMRRLKPGDRAVMERR